MKAKVMEDALLMAWFHRAYYKERRGAMETYPRMNARLDARVTDIVSRKLFGKDPR